MLRICWCLLIVRIILVSTKNETKKFDINFFQTDYDVHWEHGDVIRYNKMYFKRFEYRTFKYNRTCTANNMTFEMKRDLTDNVHVIIQTYKFASNEYRLFPIRFQYNLCEAISTNMMGYAKMTKCGNFTGCFFEKNKRYHVCNWTLEQSKFPPFIPSGKYMVEFQHVVGSEELFLLENYGSVSRMFD